MKKLFYSVLVLSFFMQNKTAWALIPTQRSPVSNSFLFIENNIDREYFIAAAVLNPRFSGANTKTKYSPRQVSLGYMGVSGWPTTALDSYTDMWLDNSPINTPFNGVRCTTFRDGCPENNHFPADKVDSLGFYHARTKGFGTAEGRYAYASFTDSAFEYFRAMTTGETKKLILNHCFTVDNYPLEEKCTDQDNAQWSRADFSVRKDGHLTLRSIDHPQRIWVASDGTPSLGMDKGDCKLGVVGHKSGIICKAVSYSLSVSDKTEFNSLFINMLNNDTVVKTTGEDDLQFSGDGNTWNRHNTNNRNRVRALDILNSSEGYVYAFISREHLKLLTASGSASRDVDLFTFTFRNTRLPQSGYYEFSPSVRLSITPRNYSISIVSSDNTLQASGSGIIGSAKPIELEYIITTSGRRQADDITAQVTGAGKRIDGTPYCIFSSTQGGGAVPIPAFLQFVNKSGRIERRSNSCIEDAVSLNDALWSQTPWDVNSSDDGNFYSTNLKLLFPMNHSRSESTVSGSEWQGIVSANGEIKVSASWNGVEK